ncbi:hypothetical protein TNCV_4163521 [Trichonephila clavipes]|nr:hypothetical protein TNCV_4163521 [Trichonephila clavipes]
MITNFFIPELNNHDVQELWFQQDGATCHTARATIDLSKDTFGDRLISRFGPVNWPPRSCDLTPLDYFFSCEINYLCPGGSEMHRCSLLDEYPSGYLLKTINISHQWLATHDLKAGGYALFLRHQRHYRKTPCCPSSSDLSQQRGCPTFVWPVRSPDFSPVENT